MNSDDKEKSMAAQEQFPSIERRVLPRCPFETDVDVSLHSRGQDKKFQTRSINISLRVLEISCGDDLIQAILAQNIYPHECAVSFKLPARNGNQESALSINTQVVTHRRLSQNEYQLVLRFHNLSKQIQEKLVNKISDFCMMADKADKLSVSKALSGS